MLWCHLTQSQKFFYLILTNLAVFSIASPPPAYFCWGKPSDLLHCIALLCENGWAPGIYYSTYWIRWWWTEINTHWITEFVFSLLSYLPCSQLDLIRKNRSQLPFPSLNFYLPFNCFVGSSYRWHIVWSQCQSWKQQVLWLGQVKTETSLHTVCTPNL